MGFDALFKRYFAAIICVLIGAPAYVQAAGRRARERALEETRKRGRPVALPKIGFNEGSLLRRTLLHVGTFVLGSSAFIGVVSFALVSVAKGIVSPHGEVAGGEAAAVATAAVKAPLRPSPGPGAARP